jgi:hypothetical protein
MAKRKPTELTTETNSDLPQVESPSISPAGPLPVNEPAPAMPVVEAAPAPAAKPAFRLRPRHRRAALLAASVTLAAALGAVVGVVTIKNLASAKPPADVAGLEERKAMQQSIAHLSQQVVTLKMNLDVATRNAHSEMEKAHGEMTKIAQRLAAAAAEVTGSITPPQTVPAAPAPEPQLVTTPLPLPQPRPVPVRLAAAEPPSRPALVPDWSIRSARDGIALVQGHGELYQAVLGADLPGLGPVQTIKREEGRWIVVTPRGIIVSMRDRRYFE